MLISFYLSMELQCGYLMSDIALTLSIQHQKILEILLTVVIQKKTLEERGRERERERER